ncbi:MAG: NAD-dependent epimerase/dehydratase family protein, partial [Blastocatellia bacterium]
VGPGDVYTRSKLAAETAVQSLGSGLVVQILRLFFPYGPTQQGRFIPNLIRRVARGEPINLANSAGQPLVTPLYIDDLVEYARCVLLVEKMFVANLAGNEVVSIRALAEAIGGLLNRAPIFDAKDGMPACNWVGNNELLSRLTGYSPHVPLQLGLERTVGAM